MLMFLFTAVVASSSLAAPDEQRATKEADLISAEKAFARLRQAHRSETIAERVWLEVESGGATQRSEATLRVSRDRGALLELGALRILAKQGVIQATHMRNGVVYYEQRINDASVWEMMRSALPPVPLPQLALAFSEDPEAANPTPMTPGVTWTDVHVPPEEEGQSDRVRLIGEFDRGEIWVESKVGEGTKFHVSFPASSESLDITGSAEADSADASDV